MKRTFILSCQCAPICVCAPRPSASEGFAFFRSRSPTLSHNRVALGVCASRPFKAVEPHRSRAADHAVQSVPVSQLGGAKSPPWSTPRGTSPSAQTSAVQYARHNLAFKFPRAYTAAPPVSLPPDGTPPAPPTVKNPPFQSFPDTQTHAHAPASFRVHRSASSANHAEIQAGGDGIPSPPNTVTSRSAISSPCSVSRIQTSISPSPRFAPGGTGSRLICAACSFGASSVYTAHPYRPPAVAARWP